MSKKMVMLVDDNDTDNFINRTIIEHAGISELIIVKNSGKGALDYFQEHMNDLSKLPDLLFLDINMPIVDGFTFLYEYDDYPASVKNKCHIIILSSSDNDNDISRIRNDVNVKDYITKPLSYEDLHKIRQ
jgi:CheY-like chemotaxis protein